MLNHVDVEQGFDMLRALPVTDDPEAVALHDAAQQLDGEQISRVAEYLQSQDPARATWWWGVLAHARGSRSDGVSWSEVARRKGH